MNKKQPSIGIIGAGMISGYHIAGLRAAGARVDWIASDSKENAQAKAHEYQIAHYTGDYRQLLAQEDLDAVVVATPDYTHREIAIAALEAGKPVLLQKPMARNSDECRQIISAARDTGVPLYVSFMHRYFEEVVATRALLAKGALGPIYSVRQRNATPGASWAAWFYRQENVGGGAMLQLGVHGIDLLRYLFGEIVAVKAATALVKEERRLDDGTVVVPDNEDLILAIYRFESGLHAVHETVYNEVAGTDRFRMEIYGDRGTAWLRTERGDLALYAPQHLGRDGWLALDLPERPFGYRQHRHFLDMLSGNEPDDHSARAGLAAVLVAEAIYRSAASDRWEEVTWPK